MPRLQLLCQKLGIALKKGEFVMAENFGRKLPVMVAAVKAGFDGHASRCAPDKGPLLGKPRGMTES